jgi:hypothetical protein
MTAISEQFSGDKIDKGLTLSGPLYHEKAPTPFDYVLDGVKLSVTEVRRRVAAACAEKLYAGDSHSAQCCEGTSQRNVAFNT